MLTPMALRRGLVPPDIHPHPASQDEDDQRAYSPPPARACARPIRPKLATLGGGGGAARARLERLEETRKLTRH